MDPKTGKYGSLELLDYHLFQMHFLLQKLHKIGRVYQNSDTLILNESSRLRRQHNTYVNVDVGCVWGILHCWLFQCRLQR